MGGHSHTMQHGMARQDSATVIANGLGVFATILSCIAMVMAIVLCTNSKSGFPRDPKDNETDKDNGSDPENPSVDLPSFRITNMYIQSKRGTPPKLSRCGRRSVCAVVGRE